jgi:hypothetical protein
MAADLDCRLCKSSDLYKFIDFGDMPLADAFLSDAVDERRNLRFELAVNLCRNCGWHQLTEVVDPKILYQEDYPYDSRVTTTGQMHWREFAESVQRFYGLSESDLVVDIGSNTGALLEEFKKFTPKIQGVDPSTTACDIAVSFGIPTINSFFDADTAQKIFNDFGFPKVITATNSFAHVDDLDAWVLAAETIMGEDSVLIVESPHVFDLFEENEFDTIYHEHLSYISVKPLVTFFAKFGLHVNLVEQREIHGGSIRIHISKRLRNDSTNSVQLIVAKEEGAKIFEQSTVDFFAYKIRNLISDIENTIISLNSEKVRVGIVSAPAKGMTLLNCLRKDLFDVIGISDRSSLKIGRFAPGTSLKVLSDKELLALNPDVLLILAWNFKYEIMNNINKISGNKIRFLIPIPSPTVIE